MVICVCARARPHERERGCCTWAHGCKEELTSCDYTSYNFIYGCLWDNTQRIRVGDVEFQDSSMLLPGPTEGVGTEGKGALSLWRCKQRPHVLVTLDALVMALDTDDWGRTWQPGLSATRVVCTLEMGLGVKIGDRKVWDWCVSKFVNTSAQRKSVEVY